MDKKILRLIKKSCALKEKVIPESQFSELSIDSLSFIELIVRIEENFNIQFEDEDLNIEIYVDVKDLMDKVSSLYEKRKDKT